MNGLKNALPAIGGALVVNPIIGAPIAGYAADEFMDFDGGLETGIAVAGASLVLGGTGINKTAQRREL